MTATLDTETRWIAGNVIRKDEDGFAIVRLDEPSGSARFGLLVQSTRDYGRVARRVTKGSRVAVEVSPIDDNEVVPAKAMRLADAG